MPCDASKANPCQPVIENHGRTFIGQNFFLYEPDFCNQIIGDTLPVISPSNLCLLPFKNNQLEIDTERTLRIPTQLVNSISSFYNTRQLILNVKPFHLLQVATANSMTDKQIMQIVLVSIQLL
jgi:hypothetical protein